MTRLSVVISNTSLGAPKDIKISKKSLIDKQLDIVEHTFPKCDTIYVPEYNYESNRLKVVKNKTSSNTAYSLYLAIKKIRYRKMLIISGETIFNKATVDINLDKNNKIIVEDSKTDYLGCSAADGKLNYICYGLPFKWTGVLYLTGKDIDIFKQICNNKRIFVFEAINELIKYTDIDMIVQPKAKSLFIQKQSDIEQAKKIR